MLIGVSSRRFARTQGGLCAIVRTGLTLFMGWRRCVANRFDPMSKRRWVDALRRIAHGRNFDDHGMSKVNSFSPSLLTSIVTSLSVL
jgi:hypothetical protein